MEIILLEKIENLGSLGDVVHVRPGYARNYLIPSGKAKYATEENLAEVQAHRAELEQRAREALSALEQRHEVLNGLELVVHAETHQEGKLFGSVGATEIARAATEAGVELERSEIRLPDGPLRSLGDFDVLVHLHVNVEPVLKVRVEASGTVAAELDDDAEQEETDDANPPPAD